MFLRTEKEEKEADKRSISCAAIHRAECTLSRQVEWHFDDIKTRKKKNRRGREQEIDFLCCTATVELHSESCYVLNATINRLLSIVFLLTEPEYNFVEITYFDAERARKYFFALVVLKIELEITPWFRCPESTCNAQRREPTTVDRARTFRSIFAEYRRRCISYRTRVCVWHNLEGPRPIRFRGV